MNINEKENKRIWYLVNDFQKKTSDFLALPFLQTIVLGKVYNFRIDVYKNFALVRNLYTH